jgi:hypothetical protein
MQVVLLRVGVDTGSGGIHGPLFQDGSFEFLWIPDKYDVEQRTYGSVVGTHGRALVEYFPAGRQPRMGGQSVHADPEFETFTYGDPTQPKLGLKRLQPGDFLAFYCGLEGWDFDCEPALYLIGYFHVQIAGIASSFDPREVQKHFSANAHVRYPKLYEEQKDRLVLVKGSSKSRLLRKAIRISEVGYDCNGDSIPVLSSKMQTIFSDLGGRICIKRSSPRWVKPAFTERAAAFVQSCE